MNYSHTPACSGGLSVEDIKYRVNVLELLDQRIDFYCYENNQCGGVYAILNLKNGKVYIGETGKPVWEYIYKNRLVELRAGKMHNPRLQKEWNFFGESSFKFYVLEYFPLNEATDIENIKESLQNLEAYYIYYFNSTNNLKGYNINETFDKNFTFDQIVNRLKNRKNANYYFNKIIEKVKIEPIPTQYILKNILPFTGEFKGLAGKNWFDSAVKNYYKNSKSFEEYASEIIEKQKVVEIKYKAERFCEKNEEILYYYLAQQIKKHFSM